MTFDPSEAVQSQLPALELLVALGYQPLSATEALHHRGGRTSNVILKDILADRLLAINAFTYRGRRYRFDLEDADEAIRHLRRGPDRAKGLLRTNQDIYDLLVLGTTITQSIGGDTKSYSFRYIDWERPENNVYHVTAEMEVQRAGSDKVRRCDLVAFVNGLPFVVIENKRPTKDVGEGVSQLIGYQGADNIPHLFHFAQLLMAMNRAEARYATVGTPAKFWQGWRRPEEPGAQEASLYRLANRPLAAAEAKAIYSGDLAAARPPALLATDARARSDLAVARPPPLLATDATPTPRAVTGQDRAIHALCRHDRLLALVRLYTVFDGGVRKIARHQQYFAVNRALDRIRHRNADGSRQGGVVWHTQGSGKSLTMVMLGRALALAPDIANPRIVIVTDRTDLDDQIRDTFRACDLEPVQARSGRHLLGLIRDRAPLVTTVVNKFDRALRASSRPDPDPDIFVLVDESHRSHTGRHGGHGQLAVRMRRLLPRACYLGFTGTPLLGREKNTMGSFGALIHRYAIDEAVADGTVVPLLYEGRFVDQQVTEETIDKWFDKLCEPLNDSQRADLKRKFSRLEALSQTDQAVRTKALDISEHFRRHWKGTGFKAQLVAPSKAAAIRFKEALDGIGDVTSEVVVSAPDDREGNEEVDEAPRGRVRAFWADAMKRFGSEQEYNRRIIDAFKGPGDPEILIVVSKLLTGFDAPRNTVLYICKDMKEHTLLQAIARVNRLHTEGEESKKFGFIIDYQGLLGELDRALTAYSALEGYDPQDLAGAVVDVRKEIARLPDLHGTLWDIFREVRSKSDMEAMERVLADDALRDEFYARLRAFSRCLHIAISSEKAYDVLPEDEIAGMRRDWGRFYELRRSVRIRYQEAVDAREFEPKIRALLDDHVSALPAETVVEVVDIHDPGALRQVAEEQGTGAASRADRIASATRRVITESMERNPAFYERFSTLLRQTIADYREKRLSEAEYLDRTLGIAGDVARGHREETEAPETIRGNEDALAFHEVFRGRLADNDGSPVDDDATARIALEVLELIGERRIVGIWSNETAQNEMRNALDDYFFDVLAGKRGIVLDEATMDDLIERVLALARARMP